MRANCEHYAQIVHVVLENSPNDSSSVFIYILCESQSKIIPTIISQRKTRQLRSYVVFSVKLAEDSRSWVGGAFIKVNLEGDVLISSPLAPC